MAVAQAFSSFGNGVVYYGSAIGNGFVTHGSNLASWTVNTAGPAIGTTIVRICSLALEFLIRPAGNFLYNGGCFLGHQLYRGGTFALVYAQTNPITVTIGAALLLTATVFFMLGTAYGRAHPAEA